MKTKVESRTTHKVNVPILMYHHVNAFHHGLNPLGLGLTVLPKNFDQQMAYLKEAGFTSITLFDLYRTIYHDDTLPDKPVIITFDDCYRDNYSHAFRILEKYNKVGTFFLISDDIGKKGHMTAEQIREMAEVGMDMQSHTKTHAMLSKCSIKKQVTELGLAKDKIERITGKPVRFVAYPFGRCNKKTADIAKSLGYLLGLTTIYGRMHNNENPFALTRIRVGVETKLPAFIKMLEVSDNNNYGRHKQVLSFLLQKLPF